MPEVYKKIFDACQERIPLHRIAKAEEIGKACVFLSSDAAAYITGQTLHVDGGNLLPVVCENSYMPGATQEEKTWRRRKQ